MFGYQVPNNHSEAKLLDKKNLRSKWADAEEKERACFLKYQVFKDIFLPFSGSWLYSDS